MSKARARWLAPLAAAAIVASMSPAAADTGGDGFYTLTLPDVVIATTGCTEVPYTIGMSAIQPGDREEGNPVEIHTPGEFHYSPSGWGETGTTPTGATTGTIQICDAQPGTYQASTDYTIYDSHSNTLGASLVLTDVTLLAPTTTTPPATSTPHKKKCKRVRRHHHWVRVCHRR
jgi:hypothetical protein